MYLRSAVWCTKVDHLVKDAKTLPEMIQNLKKLLATHDDIKTNRMITIAWAETLLRHTHFYGFTFQRLVDVLLKKQLPQEYREKFEMEYGARILLTLKVNVSQVYSC